MVRKVKKILVAILLAVCCFATPTMGATYNTYESGNLNTTYTTYFKDIVSGISPLYDYVAFRSGQYTYTLVVGDLEYTNYFKGNDVKVYEFDTDTSGYNTSVNYEVRTERTFELTTNGTVVYSNIGDFPQLVERGAQYEILQTILLCAIGLSAVIYRIFKFCLRGHDIS